MISWSNSRRGRTLLARSAGNCSAALDSPKNPGQPIGYVSRVGADHVDLQLDQVALQLHNGDGLCYYDLQKELQGLSNNRAEALSAARAIQDRARDLRRISIEHVRSVARVYFRAGWTPADVVHALDHEPDGRQHGYTSGIRSPARWAAYRLGLWLGPDGLPVASRSQLAAADRRRVLAEQAGRRAARRAPSGRVAIEGAAMARELLRQRLSG